MFQKITTGMQTVYGWIALVTMALGFAVFLMFCLALIIGGEGGAAVATAAGTIMGWGIRIAAIAILIGLISVYLKKDHTLNIKTENRPYSPPVD